MAEKIAVLTDTNSGITPEQAARYGIYLVAMPVIIDDETYFENESIFQEEFFQRLREGARVSTSQPAPGILIDCWDSLLEHYDQITMIDLRYYNKSVPELATEGWDEVLVCYEMSNFIKDRNLFKLVR